jgi:hypothetical protein
VFRCRFSSGGRLNCIRLVLVGLVGFVVGVCAGVVLGMGLGCGCGAVIGRGGGGWVVEVWGSKGLLSLLPRPENPGPTGFGWMLTSL